jgi:PAS domain-containing protein
METGIRGAGRRVSARGCARENLDSPGGKASPVKGAPENAERQARELARLRKRIVSLERAVLASRRLAAKSGGQILVHRKELDCLYAFSGIIQDSSRPVVEIAELLVDILPSGWLHPELTCACITLEEMVFQSRDFAPSHWRLRSEIIPLHQSVGTIEVFYRGVSRSNPFRPGEQELLDDITRRFARILRRKHAEETLREKEGYYREVFEKSNYGIAVTDSGRRFLDCNRAFLDLLGYESTEELQISNYDEITPPVVKCLLWQKLKQPTSPIVPAFRPL